MADGAVAFADDVLGLAPLGVADLDVEEVADTLAVDLAFAAAGAEGVGGDLP